MSDEPGKLNIKDFSCACCDGPLQVVHSTVGRTSGVVLVCARTVSLSNPENCPDATGVCKDVQEALSYLAPESSEAEPDLTHHVRILREALKGMLDMHDKVTKKINWGASFMDGATIQVMNDAPIKAREALGATHHLGQEPLV